MSAYKLLFSWISCLVFLLLLYFNTTYVTGRVHCHFSTCDMLKFTDSYSVSTPCIALAQSMDFHAIINTPSFIT